jgi:sulfate permease, SulP family
MRGPGWREQLRPSRLIPTLTAGLVIGVLEVVLASSFAALVYGGDAAVHLPKAIGFNLFGAAAVLIIISLRSSLPGVVGSIQDITAAILALLIVSITKEQPGALYSTFLTLVAAVIFASALTGVVFLLMGQFKLGDLVRFVPYPVIGGFLAGTGWLLFKGGMGVLATRSLTLMSVHRFVRPDPLLKWVPGVIFAILLLFLVRRFRHFLIIPGAVVIGVVLFYVVLAASGTTLILAKVHGFLMGPFPYGGDLFDPLTLEALTRADWGAVLGQIGNVFALLLVAVVALLLNASGIELVMNRDADLNRELRAAGLANIVGATGGGIVGFQALSLTALAYRTRATSRLVGPVAALVCILALIFGADMISLFPRAVLGGMVVFLGLAFLVEWLVDARSRLPVRDYLVVLLIVLVVAAVGFVPGVAVGLFVAIALFVIDYSKTNVVKHALSGATYQSKVERDPIHREILRREGERVHILELQGIVFFGTAHSLLQGIRKRAGDPNLPDLGFLVIDFRRVTGIDSSAVLSFTKVLQLAESRRFTVVLTGLGERASRQLEHGGLTEDAERLRIMPELDRAVQWCEDRLLESADVPPPPEAPRPLPALLRDSLDQSVDPERLMEYVEPVEVEAGHELIRQGDPSDDLYFLESGRVTAQFLRPDGQSLRLRTMGPGTVVGEVTLYLATVRTASVVAESPSKLYRLSRAALSEMERRDPHLASAVHRLFARLLADRLSDALRTMDALLD